MKTIRVLAFAVILCANQAGILAQVPSQLTVSTTDRTVQLSFAMDGESKQQLAQYLGECRPLEVRYVAELRQSRLLWPDAPFARTTVRNRVLCNSASRDRTLVRIVDGSTVATSTELDPEAVLAFMSKTGEVSAFQDVKFPGGLSYSVRVKSVLVMTPTDTLETGVLARASFEIR